MLQIIMANVMLYISSVRASPPHPPMRIRPVPYALLVVCNNCGVQGIPNPDAYGPDSDSETDG
jgi:hypothetical protein